jgi:hypothetical protein
MNKMHSTTRLTTELALIRAVPDLTLGELKPSRTAGLVTNLQKAVDKDLRYLPRINDTQIADIESIIKSFLLDIGWLDQKRHTGTYLSFCAAMIENSEFKYFPRILESINDLIDHFEKGNDFHVQSCWAGSIAAEKWETIFKEKNS